MERDSILAKTIPKWIHLVSENAIQLLLGIAQKCERRSFLNYFQAKKYLEKNTITLKTSIENKNVLKLSQSCFKLLRYANDSLSFSTLLGFSVYLSMQGVYVSQNIISIVQLIF